MNKGWRKKSWYDGFIFGEYRDIYNPWSILNYLDKGKLGTYWANTSSNSLVGKLIREGTPDIKMTMEDLLRSQTFHTVIDEQIVFNQLSDVVVHRVILTSLDYPIFGRIWPVKGVAAYRCAAPFTGHMRSNILYLGKKGQLEYGVL